MALKIEESKYYITRDGRKVGPMSIGYSSGGHRLYECEPDWKDDIWYQNGINYSRAELDLVAEWKEEEPMNTSTETYKMWKDMTPEEKGSLLLAHHEGETIYYSGNPERGLWHKGEEPLWINNLAYRVKPKEPKRETVTLGWDGNTPCINLYKGVDTHKITFDTIDGKPDCSSIKMEEI